MLSFALKRVFKHKKYTLNIMMKIAITVMLVFTVIQLGNTLVSQYKHFLTSQEIVDFVIEDVTIEEVESFSTEFPTENKAISIKSRIGFINIPTTMYRGWLTAGNEESLNTFDHINISEGKFPEGEFEIAIEHNVNKFLETPYKIGDKLVSSVFGGKLVDNDSQPYTFTVCGIIDSIGQLENISNNSVTYAVISLKTAEIIVNENNIEEPYRIEVLSDANIYNYDSDLILRDSELAKSVLYPEYENLMSKIIQNGIDSMSEKELEIIRAANGRVKFNSTKEEVYTGSTGMQSGNIAMIVTAIIISAVSVILLFNSMNIGFSKQIKQWGSMRAIGLTQKQLTHLLMLEGGIYYIGGAMIGLIGGRIFAELIGSTVVSALIKSDIPLSVSFGGYILSLLMTFIAVVTSVLIISMKSAKLSPLQMMNYSENTVNHVSKFTTNSVSFLIALRQVYRRKTTSLTIFSILLVYNIIFAIIANFVLSINWPEKGLKENISNFEVVQDWHGDYFEPFNNDVVSEISTAINSNNIYAIGHIIYFGAKNVETDESIPTLTYSNSLFKLFCDNADIPIANIDRPMAISVGDIDASGKYDISVSTLDYMTEEGSFKEIHTDEINVTHHTQMEHFTPGDLMNYNTEGKEGKLIIINEAYAEEFYGQVYYNNIFFDADLSEDDILMQINPVISEFTNHRYVSHKFSLDPNIKQLLAMLFIAFMVTAFVTIVLFEVEISAVKSSIILYKKEYSTYRAVGASLAYVKRIIVLEAFAISLISAVVSIPLSAVINMVMTGMMLDEMSVNLVAILAVPVLNLLIYCLIAKHLSKELNKQSIYNGLRTE